MVLKRNLTSLVVSGMQIKATRYHFLFIRLVKIQKLDDLLVMLWGMASYIAGKCEMPSVWKLALSNKIFIYIPLTQ